MLGGGWLAGRVGSRWLCRGRSASFEGRLLFLESTTAGTARCSSSGAPARAERGRETAAREGAHSIGRRSDGAREKHTLERRSQPWRGRGGDRRGGRGRGGSGGPRKGQGRQLGPVGRTLEEEGIEKAMETMEREGTTAAVKELLGCCRRNRSLKLTAAKVWEIYDRFVHCKKGSDKESVDLMLLGELALCQATHGDCSMGGRVWQELEKHGIKPSPFIISVLARIFAKHPTQESMERLLTLLEGRDASDSKETGGSHSIADSATNREERTQEHVAHSAAVDVPTGGEAEEKSVLVLESPWKPDLMDVTNLMVGIGKLQDGDAALDVGDYVVDHMEELSPDSHCFTAMIGMFSGCGERSAALDVLDMMSQAGVKPNAFTMTALFSCLTAVEAPLEDFAYATKAAREAGVLEEIPTVNAMMDYHASAGDSLRTLELLRDLLARGQAPNEITFTTALKACGLAGALDHGREVEAMLETRSESRNASVLVSRLLMYTKCDDPSAEEDGHRLFESAREVSGMSKNAECKLFTAYVAFCTRYGAWKAGRDAHLLLENRRIRINAPLANALVRFYANQGNKRELTLLNRSIEQAGIALNEELLTSLASALTSNGMINECKRLQERAKERFEANELRLDVELATALILMYRHTGPFTEISSIYEKIGHRRLKEKTVVALIRSAEKWNQPEFGAALHRRLEKRTRGRISPTVRAALIDMYSACGRPAAAHDTFQTAVVDRVANIGCWTAIIKAFARQGEVESAMLHFRQLLLLKLQPQAETVLAMLEALCGQGMVDQACGLLDSLPKELKMTPAARHRLVVANALRAAGMHERADEVEAPLPPRSRMRSNE